VARLAKTPDLGTTLDLLAEQNDGNAFVFTNRPFLGLDVPPGRTVHHAEGVDAKGLLYLMSRHRPRMPWLPLDVDELPRRFEDAYPKERAWRDKRGFSEAEAKRFLQRQSRLRTGAGA